ncbi:SRPBCC family protein [Ramlibacter sp. PS4R-6]|uniref:SRPBCC family protein n=1 Tax=Ramlibacter sp. PS4R-6 TaxID=3133438 RepID=UPI00309A35B4
MAETQDKPVLEITRRYDAPPERVWQAWTDAQALTRWFGPGGTDSVTQADLDVRPGGRYTIAFRTPDGEEHRVSGVYEQVAAPRLLSFTWAWQSTPDRVSFVQVELVPDGGGTRMHFRHDRFFDRSARDNHERGWTATLAKLDALMASG